MSSRQVRPIAAWLVVLVLFCVPGLTRAGQRLDPSGPRPQPFGFFSKSGDLPPDTISILPDVAVASWLPCELVPERIAPPIRVDEALPSAPQPEIQRGPRPPPPLSVQS